MSKQKTVKALAKRFKVTKSGKVTKMKAGRNHFNANESGKIKRNKRMSHGLTNKKQTKLIKTFTS